MNQAIPESMQVFAFINHDEEDPDAALLNMDGADINTQGHDYEDSLHFKISQQLKSKMILTRGQKLGLNQAKLEQLKTKIKFGSTNIKQYHNIGSLGKGTYGEVNKCLHKDTKEIVAVKTFLFEVSPRFLIANFLCTERQQRHKLQHNARNLLAQTAQRVPVLREAPGRP